MIGYILFGIGLIAFLIGFVWWIIELILQWKTKNEIHMSLMWIALITLMLGNLMVQIGNIIVKFS